MGARKHVVARDEIGLVAEVVRVLGVGGLGRMELMASVEFVLPVVRMGEIDVVRPI